MLPHKTWPSPYATCIITMHSLVLTRGAQMEHHETCCTIFPLWGKQRRWIPHGLPPRNLTPLAWWEGIALSDPAKLCTWVMKCHEHHWNSRKHYTSKSLLGFLLRPWLLAYIVRRKSHWKTGFMSFQVKNNEQITCFSRAFCPWAMSNQLQHLNINRKVHWPAHACSCDTVAWIIGDQCTAMSFSAATWQQSNCHVMCTPGCSNPYLSPRKLCCFDWS